MPNLPRLPYSAACGSTARRALVSRRVRWGVVLTRSIAFESTAFDRRRARHAVPLIACCSLTSGAEPPAPLAAPRATFRGAADRAFTTDRAHASRALSSRAPWRRDSCARRLDACARRSATLTRPRARLLMRSAAHARRRRWRCRRGRRHSRRRARRGGRTARRTAPQSPRSPRSGRATRRRPT